MTQTTILETSNQQLLKGVFVALSLCFGAPTASFGGADSTLNKHPLVELNANFAGCIKPSIENYSFSHDFVNATLKIEKDDNFSEGPCVCRAGLYYFIVYASDRELPAKRAWMFVRSYYKADLAIGVLPLKPYPMPHFEIIHFPVTRNSKGEPSSRYYIAVGCP